ncbi:hypothetical protein SH580_19210 [Coraliomargarita algicola]|uniref:Autotransporter outer membrane beta-barrel domain-containing protein n=1 Tax=Coraliomargarita algicola TaxID=3092156 RepID=A0ABZ0RH92_9BACT|nr:hypothetical protein [Coraliomargarita sp. J2-16]WPJ95550.1 hypothetical protein SH580_19210 [Coraliomargarita sp. J2-16]
MNKPLQFSSGLIGTCLAMTGLATVDLKADTVTWTSSVNGNWSDGANWDTSPNPPATSGDDIIFQAPAANYVSTVDATWATAGAVNSLTFSNGTTLDNYTLDTGANTLGIGAGGITNLRDASNGSVYLTGAIEATANQTWTQSSTNGNRGKLYMSADLSGSGDITISGVNGTAFYFDGGSSAAYDGNFILDGIGVLYLLGNDQVNRLGTNAIQWQNNSSTGVFYNNLSGADQALSMNTPIFFDSQSGGTRTIEFSGSLTGNSTMDITGAWTGELNGGFRIFNQEDALLVRFKQDGSTLTSSKGSGNQTNSAVYLTMGDFSIENNNAFGSGEDAVSISLGNGGATTQGLADASFTAIDGITVNSDLWANSVWNNTENAAMSNVVTIGVRDADATATFNGKLTVQRVSYNADVATMNKQRSPNVHLMAVGGSTASFTGDIVDDQYGEGFRYAPVIIDGGGAVILSGANSSYRGGTSVIEGTTFYANGGSGASGSTTGSGSLQVGYDSAAITGDMSSGQSYITGVDTSNLHVGQSLSGAGIAEGTFITYIHPTIAGRIELSEALTADGTGVSITVAAETGVLGGSGMIKPGVVNSVDQSISVASGSSIAPGNSIGTLTLNGADTSAALLTMDAGAAFNFEVDGSGGASDQLQFWNYVSGDLVLNNNDLNITLSGLSLRENTRYRYLSSTAMMAAPLLEAI